MNFESKYNLGDHIYCISRGSVQLPPVTCTACEGSGMCDLRGERFHCPKCSGRGQTLAKGWGWTIADSGTIRSIQAFTIKDEDRADYDDSGRPYAVKYMFSADGCGTVYAEHELWPSREAAQAECDRRNEYTRAKGAAA